MALKLPNPYAIAAGGLMIVALVGGSYGKGRYDQHQHDAPIIADYKKAASDYKAASKTWKARYSRSQALRGQEAQQAADAVGEAAKQCDARVLNARASERATQKLLSRPVKVDAKGCPVPAIWGPADLAGPLNGWGR